eukprot:154199_1
MNGIFTEETTSPDVIATYGWDTDDTQWATIQDTTLSDHLLCIACLGYERNTLYEHGQVTAKLRTGEDRDWDAWNDAIATHIQAWSDEYKEEFTKFISHWKHTNTANEVLPEAYVNNHDIRKKLDESLNK